MWNPLVRAIEREAIVSRVHVDSPAASPTLTAALVTCLCEPTVESQQPLVILCIGTDRSTGDSLGPLTGSKLKEDLIQGITVYGTLEEPVHAANLANTLEIIYNNNRNPFIIAIDACLGRVENIGFITLKRGPLQPGTGVNKALPSVGQLHIVGTVNVGGYMEYLVLQNTRLSLVVKMASIISSSLSEALAAKSRASLIL